MIPPATIAQYRILSHLGKGGMGEVYLAEDTRLGRKVALKVLPVQFAKDPERLHRFELEARAASALNHPNIITIFDVGEVDGLPFISTEFIEGQTLRQLLRGSQLDLRQALDVAAQVAAALSASHQAGIVHRDIKPENIIIRPDGYVKVLDFGLAKLTEPYLADSDTEEMRAPIKTDTEVILGTASYMSPEQIRGKAVDARSDVFSLGVVLYEMIAGTTPFQGTTKADRLVAILQKEPTPPSRIVAAIPLALEQIVNKALSKNPEARYQTAKDLQMELRNLREEMEFEAKREQSGLSGTSERAMRSAGGEVRDISTGGESLARTTTGAGRIIAAAWLHRTSAMIVLAALAIAIAAWIYFRSGSTAIRSLAVLPFVNAAGDPNTEYLSDGITESLIDSLSQLPNMMVMSRSSVFRYKGKETDAQEIGRRLKVQAVLTGWVRPLGNELYVSAELVDVHNNTHLWGEQYHRRLSDIVSLQAEIAGEMSDTLRVKLTGADRNRLTKRYTENTEAYQLYLKGRYSVAKFTKKGLDQGLEYFNKAIDLDPGYAMAYHGVAYYYVTAADWFLPAREAMPRARDALLKTLKIDEALSEAHTSIGIVYYWYDWNWAMAEKELRRAIELKPNNAGAHEFYGAYLSWMGKFDAGITESRRAIVLDPLSPEVNTYLGINLFFARRYNEALEQLQETVKVSPNYWFARVFLGRCHEQMGNFAEAIREFEWARRIEDEIPEIYAALGHAYALAGKQLEAEIALGQLKERATRSHVSPYNMAIVCAGLGRKNEALEWLEKAYEQRPYYLVWLKIDPNLDTLRSEARFLDLVKRIGLP
jgi:TolB-like protein/Flp pilus assembly protein TadD/predicted Ser/Thr protein kinase